MLIRPICNAVRNKTLLSFTYKDEIRKVEPHSCYTDNKGKTFLWAWQTSGVEPGWRKFNIDNISYLTALAETFSRPRPEYKQLDPGKPYTLHCQL
jgi:predicted DNA-binding transcriptional regulator YafY